MVHFVLIYIFQIDDLAENFCLLGYAQTMVYVNKKAYKFEAYCEY